MLTETKYYELSYLLKPALQPEEAIRFEEELRVTLDNFHAALESWDSPRRKPLSYLIANETEAYMGALRFTMPREHAHDLEETMKKNKNVMRSVLLGWRKNPPRRITHPARPVEQKDEQVPTDEKALDEKLEEIFAKNA